MGALTLDTPSSRWAGTKFTRVWREGLGSGDGGKRPEKVECPLFYAQRLALASVKQRQGFSHTNWPRSSR